MRRPTRIAMLGALFAVAALERPARAYAPPSTTRPHVVVRWAAGSTGFVALGNAAVMFAAESGGKSISAISAGELRASIARAGAGPFEPATIENSGKTFAWRPPTAGLWFLRVDRRTENREPPKSGGAIVLAYEPKARARVRLVLSSRGRLRNTAKPIALLPWLSEKETAGPQDECCEDLLFPYLFLLGPRPSDEISVRLPRGRYDVREASTLRSTTGDRGGALRYVELSLPEPEEGAHGSVEIVSDGDVAVEERPICKIPLHRR